MINEFKDFIARGNVMDMAVGIIIGAAFTAIVTSLVGDLINPIIALFTGGIDFSGWFYSLDGEAIPRSPWRRMPVHRSLRSATSSWRSSTSSSLPLWCSCW
jgi:hypothetical protein